MPFEVTYRYECEDCGYIRILDSWPDECPRCVAKREKESQKELYELKQNAPVSRTVKENGKYRYSAYYGKEWDEVRKGILERDDYECQECGLTHEEHKADDKLFGEGLHVHHIVKAKEFDDPDVANSPDNLVALCANCHRDAM